MRRVATDVGELCAGGCGKHTGFRKIYCEECAKHKVVSPPETDYELDIHTEVLEEQIHGKNKIQKRLAERGPGVCGACGRPCLPWKVYCSDACHGRAPRLGPATFELDGIVDSLLGHAARLGINEVTVRKRMRKHGMGPIEALTKPVDLKMSRRKKKLEKAS